MFELHLVIADSALRSAVAEQIRLAPLANIDLHEHEAMPSQFFKEPAALLIDGPLADKKLLKALHDMGHAGPDMKIFVLGEIELDDGVVTESFAKPLRLGHLLARLQFHLQSARVPGEPFRFGIYCLQPAARQVVVENSDTIVRLTEKEAHLLEYLGRSKKPVTREELLAAIWGYDARIDTHTLETHIYRLRRKLDPDGNGTRVIIADQGAYSLAG
jgi:DNA-binding response OmpR family regulator